MKPIVVIVAGLTLVDTASVISTDDTEASPRTHQECRALFQQLNQHGDGRLTVREIAGSQLMVQGPANEGLWQKGYVTEDEFTPVCETASGGTTQRAQ
jgi:hypothetical protein